MILCQNFYIGKKPYHSVNHFLSQMWAMFLSFRKDNQVMSCARTGPFFFQNIFRISHLVKSLWTLSHIKIGIFFWNISLPSRRKKASILQLPFCQTFNLHQTHNFCWLAFVPSICEFFTTKIPFYQTCKLWKSAKLHRKLKNSRKKCNKSAIYI